MENLKYIYSNNSSGRPYYTQQKAEIKEFRTKDNACVVLKNTEVVYAAESERFTKKKHDFALPEMPFNAFLNFIKSMQCQFHISVVEELDAPRNHHCHHIYETFYQSGFHEAAVLVNDGEGNLNDCITLAYMQEQNKPFVLKKIAIHNDTDSPCNMYNVASKYIFQQDNAEGKLMGLAAYGKNNGHSYISWNMERNDIERNPNLLLKDIEKCFTTDIPTNEHDVMLAQDVAFTIQENFESTLVSVSKFFKELLLSNNIHTKNLCMSGGGILNCPTNSKIVDLGLFEHYYASPQPCDGCAEAVGKAFKTMEAQGELLKSQRLKSAYLGVPYHADDLPYKHELLESPIQRITNHLSNGGVVAWFQDGAEYGPRALGHRSFLADPSKKGMLNALNTIKGREQWRPLAPVVAEELFHRLFDVDNTDMCEFMLRTLTFKERWQNRLKAVCHTDGTTRPQLLTHNVNPQLYDLLMTYFEQEHVPCLVNTSLNINGFPIVETPRDFCNLLEEIHYINRNIPDVLPIFIENGKFYEVILPKMATPPKPTCNHVAKPFSSLLPQG